MKDSVLLVADKNIQFALKGAIGRSEALDIRPIEFEFRVHPGRDGGARKTGSDVLALERRRFAHAMLVMDFDGSGTDLPNSTSLEGQLDQRLRAQWDGRAKAIVIEPELDVWIWGSDNALEKVIEWPGGKGVRDWLRERGFSFDQNDKPKRPKEALETALRVPSLPRSSALYQRIAEKLSLRRCADDSFIRLRKKLMIWFPGSNGTKNVPVPNF